ncbi:MAG TPA: M20/M25/M40 family metallo-hydrolase [Trueperaceae bacterium]|nr:M20/M25/M40 family metallo-hydrolase [Trueperaceae bacterium]
MSQALGDPAPAGLAQRLVDLVVLLAETPAPTFAESARAEVVARLWSEAGLEPRRDAAGNVVADVPGGSGPVVLVAAHLDSVFGEGTDVRVRRDGDRLLGPGVGDDAAGLALLTAYLQELPERRPRLVVAATVGEEGAGDLRGARQVVADHKDRVDHFVAFDGHLGSVCHQGVGSLRHEVVMTTAGGHSWGDYPSPSAVHAVGRAVARLAALPVPREPRSSLNVGLVWGGTSVNSIAAEAGFALDLRSVDQRTLELLWEACRAEVERVAEESGCGLTVSRVGARPAGASDNARLVEAARKALSAVGIDASLAPASTDANAAMAAGLSAVALGAYRGGGAHTLSEWVDATSLPLGLEVLRRFLAELAA